MPGRCPADANSRGRPTTELSSLLQGAKRCQLYPGVIPRVIRLSRKLVRAICDYLAMSLLISGLLACVGLGAAAIRSYAWAEYHYQAAQRALDRGDFAGAREHLASCLEARPDSAETHFLAARAARRALDYREADRQLRACQRLGGVRGLIDLERQLTRAQRGDLAKVGGPLLSQAQRGHPEAVLILEALSRGYLQNFRLEEALRSLQLWLESRPDDVQALLWRGEVWERLLHPEDALADYRRALELAPERDDDRLHLAETLLNCRQPEEAARHLALLAERRPEDPIVLLNLARCRRLKGKPDEARRLLDQVLARAPRNAAALAERGRLELENNRPADAEPWLRQAVALLPYEKEVVYALCQSLQQTGQEAEAEKYHRQLDKIQAELDRLDLVLRRINAAPNDPALRHEAGMVFLTNGQPQEGLRWLSSGLQLDPLYEPTHEALAKYFDSLGERGQASWHRELAHQRPFKTGSKLREWPVTVAGKR